MLTYMNSSIPILRQLGAQERKLLLNDDFLSMAKVWVALETRQFINASVQDVSAGITTELPSNLTLSTRSTILSSVTFYAQIVDFVDIFI